MVFSQALLDPKSRNCFIDRGQGELAEVFHVLGGSCQGQHSSAARDPAHGSGDRVGMAWDLAPVPAPPPGQRLPLNFNFL